MGQAFSKELINFFQCKHGAYSVITKDEFKKSQVTFVGAEKELAESYFGEKLKNHQGSIKEIKSQGIDPELEFRIYPTGEIKRLTVSYKTNRSNELRYYARKDVFKPQAGEYWCIFEKNDEIWLGAFSEWMLNAINQKIITNDARISLIEPEVDEYQQIINQVEPQKIKSKSMKWKRNPIVAAKALNQASYKCELYPKHPAFISRTTGKNYVEAHHLIPMSLQGKFSHENLDNIDNICVLGPYINKKIH